MPQFSYLQQIINRAQIGSDRPVADLPILHPTRPLFRQWEMHQPLAVENKASQGEEQPLPPTFTSQASPTPVETAPTRRLERSLEHPLASPLAVSSTPMSSTPIPTPSSSGRLELESLPQAAGEIDFPLPLPVLPAISPVRALPAELPPQPILPSTAATQLQPPNTPPTIPTDTTPAVQHQPTISPLSDQGREKSQPVAVEMPSALSGIPQPVGNGEWLVRQRGKRQQPKDAFPGDALSQQGDRSTMRPRVLIPPEPLPDQRSQQDTGLPPPQSATYSLQTTLQPPPAGQSSQSTNRLALPHRWVESGNGSSKRQENTVHIGSIDVHIMPPPLPPAHPTKPALKSPPSQLSRGFISSFGLRQG